MTLYPDQLFKDLLNDFRAIEQYSGLFHILILIKKSSILFFPVAPSPILTDLNELYVLTEGTEVFHSTESNDIAGRRFFYFIS